MSYTVLVNFCDMEDDNYTYVIGDEYPREGYVASEDRIAYLLNDDNEASINFIKEVENEILR